MANNVLTGQQKVVIEASGFGISGTIGGIRKQTYWTPDGRKIQTPPCIRDYVIKDKDGNVIESGQRDANLDKGWLTRPPSDSEKQLFCHWCDGWHKTPAEVESCRKAQQKTLRKFDQLSKNETRQEIDSKDAKIAELEKKLDKLMAMMEGKIG